MMLAAKQAFAFANVSSAPGTSLFSSTDQGRTWTHVPTRVDKSGRFLAMAQSLRQGEDTK